MLYPKKLNLVKELQIQIKVYHNDVFFLNSKQMC